MESKGDLIRQIQAEYSQSMGAVQSKRLTFWNRLRLRNEQTKTEDKMSVNLIYANEQTLL
jgi:hypothetical protein